MSNTRIKELFEQAKTECFTMGSKPGITVGLDELDRFAELIVRECANVAADHDALDIYEEIREHFGVNE